MTYNNADQLTKVGTTTYTYDANGQQLSAGSRSFVWDVAGRLTSSTNGASTVTYAYDGDGKRLSASTGPAAAQTTKSLWDTTFALPELTVERDGADQPLRRYVHGLETVSEVTPAGEFFFHLRPRWGAATTAKTVSRGAAIAISCGPSGRSSRPSPCRRSAPPRISCR